jgi:hypothetical protein
VLQYCRSCCRGVARTTANAAQRYLWSLDHPALLALFTSTTVALIVHKVTLISLRFPLPFLSLVFLTPFLFAFDIVTLRVLYLALSSRGWIRHAVAWILCILIIAWSATFVSVYLETHGEANWGRMVEVNRPADRRLI